MKKLPAHKVRVRQVHAKAEAASGKIPNALQQPLKSSAELAVLVGDGALIYRFLDDEAGKVIAESRRDNLHTFMNHHFPASDIPRQARTLYVRNLIRVISDVTYEPALLSGPYFYSICGLFSAC